VVEEGWVENVYRLQIMNAAEALQHYQVSVDGLPGVTLVDVPKDLLIGPAEARWITVSVRLPAESAQQVKAGAHTIHFEIGRLSAEGAAPLVVREKSTFMVPR
jgi:polyferredoxin